MAVKQVRPQLKFDKDGIVDKNLISDTIEVVAYFDDPNKADSFFALISYLNYAKKQIRKSFDWILFSTKKYASEKEFPWKNIDDSLIETEGFERKLFEFVLDQNKILNLLVGHTLYNDSTVVLRELIQNSIDAIRLLNYEKESIQIAEKIIISWNTSSRELKILDEGIGMSQDTIENFLLKVGSSRYQDEEFKKKHPGFSSISRFGIGILTCFLVSDEIDIITLTQDDNLARKISIRNLDGKYLIQEIAKKQVLQLGNHGTEITLKVRHDVNMNKLSADINNWVVFPICETILKIDDQKNEIIGFKSPTLALKKMLQSINVDPNAADIKIEEVEKDGVCLAYVLKYDKYFREWHFFKTPDYYEEYIKCGTCIEGIKVEFSTPGYTGNNIFAFANISAEKAPKTNVSRSNFEGDSEYSNFLIKVYDVYSSAITHQINNLHTQDKYSLTWAITEGKHLIQPLLSSHRRTERVYPTDQKLLINSLFSIPCILIENNSRREAYSVNQCNKLNSFWLINNDLFRSAEFFLQAIDENSSIMGLMEHLSTSLDKKFDVILCGYDKNFELHRAALESKGVDEIIINEQKKELALNWSQNGLENWHTAVVSLKDEYRRNSLTSLFIQKNAIKGNVGNKAVVRSNNQIFVLENSQLHTETVELIAKRLPARLFEMIIDHLLVIVLKYASRRFRKEYLFRQIQKEFATDWTSSEAQKIFESSITIEKMLEILTDLEDRIYDSSIFKRKEIEEQDYTDDLPF